METKIIETGSEFSLPTANADNAIINERRYLWNMEIDTMKQALIYMQIYKQVVEQVKSEQAAIAILQEVGKEHRSEILKQAQFQKQDYPATENQMKYLKRLGIEIPEGLTKAQASLLIQKETASVQDDLPEDQCHGAVKMYQGRAVENRPC